MEALDTTVDITRILGKSIFITGGASGIGLACAKIWSSAGAIITIADVQPVEKGRKLAAELSEKGGRVQYVFCDVTDWDSQVAAFKQAVQFSPTQTLDIVATFAGTAFAGGNQVDHILAAGPPSLDRDPVQPDIRNIQVNLIGLYYTSCLALYYLQLQPLSNGTNGTNGTNGINGSNGINGASHSAPDKSLILVSSIGGYMDSPKACTYPASKFGVRGLFRSSRARTMDIGVRCNLLAPWFVDTPLIAPMKNAMASRGIDMAKKLSFAGVDSCVDAATFCAIESGLHGRALAIQPEGIFDLKDDLEDGWGGDQLRPIMKRRREAGFDA